MLLNNFPIFSLSGNTNKSIFKICNVLWWVHLLVMNKFYNIFSITFCWIWAGNVCMIIYIPFSIYYCCHTLFRIRVFSLLSSFNDASVDIAYDKGSSEFSPKLNTHQPRNWNWNGITVLCTAHNCHSVKNMLKLLAFKWLLIYLLIETKYWEVMLVW